MVVKDNINITYQHTPNLDSENNFKDALLASSYSPVLFLKTTLRMHY